MQRLWSLSYGAIQLSDNNLIKNMRLQIDTEAKTIKLTADTKFDKLIEVLDKFFPNKEWLSYTLETNTIINNWSNPIVITPTATWPYLYGRYPVTINASNGWSTSNTQPIAIDQKNSIYNLELKNE